MPFILAAILAGLVLLADPRPASTQTRTIAPREADKAAGTGYYADSWAVIVGINDYQHPRIPKLRYAVNDARAVERTLLAQGFRQDRIVTLIDGEATKHRIESVLGDDLRRKVGTNDRVLVFFAGHGKTDQLRSGEDEGYLIPVDGDPSGLFGSAISMTALRQISDRLPAKHILYIVDACYSGYAVFNRGIADDLLEEMVKKPAIQILTAGRQQDQAQEREGHGVFTQVLVRGLAGDAFTGKDWVALEELGVWMKQRVFAESNRKQLPQFGNISGEGQFVFLRPGEPVVATVAPPAPGRPTVRIEPRQQLGSVAFVSQIEGIEVWLGDDRIGETRAGSVLLVEQLGAGRYRIRAQKQGHKPWEREIQVAANQRSDVVIDIEPLRPDGSTTIKTDDGAEMVLIPAGEFWMGSDGDDERERPRHRAFLDRYHIDKHEKTNDQFKRFIDARGYERQELWSPAGWQWRTSQHGGFEQASAVSQPRFSSDSKWNGPTQPVVGVSWWEADAFCRFAGKRLPTEAEWEKAARGTEGRRYPWGESWEHGRSNSDQTNLGRTLPVGSYPQGVSAYGVHDMAGNVSEWVADWYSKEYYRRSPERNPKGPVGGESKVLRGGSWDNKGKDQRSTFRHDDTPSERGRRIGFRCAKDAEP